MDKHPIVEAKTATKSLVVKKVEAKKPIAEVKKTQVVVEKKCETCQKCDDNFAQLSQHGSDFTLKLGEEEPESLEFTVLPKNAKNGVQKLDMQVISSERIIGYSSGVVDKSKMLFDDSDYYNVTVNMVVKKGSGYSQTVQ